MIEANTIMKQRMARASHITEITSETTSLKEDFQPMETSSGQITLETADQDYPSTTHICVPKSEMGIRCNETMVCFFEEGVKSVLQLFVSPTQSIALKLCYVQLMAFLTETTSDEDYVELGIQTLSTETFGGQKFLMARETLMWFIQMERRVYTEREIYVITELQKRINIDYRSLPPMVQLNYVQNNLWYMMRNGTSNKDELLKKKMKELLVTMNEITRINNNIK